MDAKALRERFIAGLKKRIQNAENAEARVLKEGPKALGIEASSQVEAKVDNNTSPMMAKFGLANWGKKKQ